jgi:hypothetical protein
MTALAHKENQAIFIGEIRKFWIKSNRVKAVCNLGWLIIREMEIQ